MADDARTFDDLEQLLRDAANGDAEPTIRLATTSAAIGGAAARAGTTMDELIGAFDVRFGAVLNEITARSASAASIPDALSTVQSLHGAGAMARRAMIAGYGQAASVEARHRARIARHDVANAVGAVHNALVLLEDETVQLSREQITAMAKRNSRSSEILMRGHLSDQAALSPALGWRELRLPTNGAGGETTHALVVTNIAALHVLLDVLRDAIGDERTRLALSLGEIGRTSAVVQVHADGRAARPWTGTALDSLQGLASMLGLELHPEPNADGVRVVVPLSPRDERNDLRRERERHDADTLSL